MKHRFGFFALLFGWATLVAAQERFTDRLAAEEKKTMGLERLSPEQVAALNALVQRDRQHSAGQIREQAKAEAKTELQQAREAETRVLGRVVGKYSGWDGATQFRLENGQVWRQSEPGVFYTKPVENAAVLIEKVYGGWRLYDQNGGWVRVVRIK